MSDIAIVYAILAMAVVLFISGRVPVGLVAIGVALVAVGDGAAAARDGAVGLRRPDGAVHREPVRGQRGPGRDRGHGVGRVAADRPGGGGAGAARPADDAAGRGPDGRDLGQRRGRGAAARRRRDRRADRAGPLAAPDAARVRGARGLDAHPDRHARERDRGRLREGPDRHGVRVLRVRPRRDPAAPRDHRRGDRCRAEAPAGTEAQGPPRGPVAARADAGGPVRAGAAASRPPHPTPARTSTSPPPCSARPPASPS